jgi:hypothetical protein
MLDRKKLPNKYITVIKTSARHTVSYRHNKIAASFDCSCIPYFPAHKTHFFPEKCDLNSTRVLCAEGKCYFQTYKYPYIFYTTSLSWYSEDDFSASDDDFMGFCDE